MQNQESDINVILNVSQQREEYTPSSQIFNVAHMFKGNTYFYQGKN